MDMEHMSIMMMISKANDMGFHLALDMERSSVILCNDLCDSC